MLLLYQKINLELNIILIL